MNNYRLGDIIWENFIVSNNSTGAATNADTLPICKLIRNGTDDNAVNLTVTNIDAGRYRISGVVPTTYTVGDRIDIWISGTISSVYAKDIKDLGKIGPLQVNVVHWSGGNVFATSTGAPIADIRYVNGSAISLSSGLDVNVISWSGVAVASPDTNGYPKVTIKSGTGVGEMRLNTGILSSVMIASSGLNSVTVSNPGLNVNVIYWSGVAVASPDTSGYPKTTIKSGTGTGEVRLNAGIISGAMIASSGLDSISVADPGAPAAHTSIPKMLVALWRRAYKKNTMTTSAMVDYADDNSTPNATSNLSDDGTTQTKDAAS